jgi:hypothetical protein
MLHTYKAILRGDRIEWSDTPPAEVTPERPIAVHVTVLDESLQASETEQPGHQMAAILEQLAQINAFKDVADPVAWERDERNDRNLPEREG